MTKLHLRARAMSTSRRPQSGVTLVEVLVGMTLGMVVSAALLLVFANASANGQNVQRVAIDVENGRYMAEILRDELRLAGFMGELSTAGAAFSSPDPCATDVDPTTFVAAPLTVPTPIRGYTAAEVPGCLAGRSRQAATDALAVRRLEVATTGIASLPGGNTRVYLQSSFCADDPPVAPLVFSKTPAALTLRNRACNAPNAARAYVSRLFFVAACNECGRDTTPTFKRLDLVDGRLVETALVDGIEHFRLEYGFDTDDNGSADVYATVPAAAGAASLWHNVTTLRVHYIVRSVRPNVGAATVGTQRFTLGAVGAVDTPNDGFVRRAYTTTIRLENPSSTRELQ